MNIQALTLENFATEHLQKAAQLSKAVGWPHREEDWALTLRLSEGAVCMNEDQMVATALATSYGDVATVNMIIVDENMRGNGLGRQIMQKAMALYHPKQWRLIATISGRPLYEKIGFKVTGMITQLQGLANPASSYESQNSEIYWANPEDIGKLATMDFAATGMQRTKLFSELLSTNAKVAIIKDENGLSGYGVLRDFGRGQLIGPVVAKDNKDAKEIYTKLLHAVSGKFVRTDMHENDALATWLEDQGLDSVDKPVAMSLGHLATDRTKFKPIALASQALG